MAQLLEIAYSESNKSGTDVKRVRRGSGQPANTAACIRAKMHYSAFPVASP